MSKISAYSTVPAGGYRAASLVVDGDQGTRRVSLGELFDFINRPQYDNNDEKQAAAHIAMAHRRYRGKYLGTEITAEQYEAITSGTFEDIYVGDYWVIDQSADGNSSTQIITVADIDYAYAREKLDTTFKYSKQLTSKSTNTHSIVLFVGGLCKAPGIRPDIYVSYGHSALYYNHFRGCDFAAGAGGDERGHFWATRVISGYFKNFHTMRVQLPNATGSGMWNELGSEQRINVSNFLPYIEMLRSNGSSDRIGGEGQIYDLLSEEVIFGSLRGGQSCGDNFAGAINLSSMQRMFALFDQAPWSLGQTSGNENLYISTYSNPETTSAAAGSQAIHLCVYTVHGGIYVHGAGESHIWVGYTMIG